MILVRQIYTEQCGDNMAVFGEETIELNIFNGLGDSYIPNEKYNFTHLNLFKTGLNQLVIRDDFLMVQEVVKANPVIPITQPIPRNIVYKDLEIFTVLGSPNIESPTLMACLDNGTTLDVTWLNCNSSVPVSVTQTLPASHGIKALTQFKDRFYAANSTRIFRVYNFTPLGSPPLATTDLLVIAGGVDLLVTFKNRVFGIKKNRIYYTDLPAAGLYPETWNSAINFIDAASVNYDITIWNVKVFRDKLYLFTDKGIYYLQANGDPTNWNIQVVSTSFSIYDRDSVCMNRNLLFFTDQSSVYTFDGSKITNITDKFKTPFYNTSSTDGIYLSVYPFEDGIILNRSGYTMAGANYVVGSSVSYYYNMEIWITLTIEGAVGKQVIKAGTDFIPYRGKTGVSFIYYASTVAGGGANTTSRGVIFDVGNWKGDCFSTDFVGGARSRKSFSLIGPARFAQSRYFTKFKYIAVYGRINDSDPVTVQIQGTPLTSAQMINTAAVFKGANAVAFIGALFQSGFLYKDSTGQIVGSIGADRSAISSQPPLVITKMDAIVNLDNADSALAAQR